LSNRRILLPRLHFAYFVSVKKVKGYEGSAGIARQYVSYCMCVLIINIEEWRLLGC
jgi:hypothetical protein